MAHLVVVVDDNPLYRHGVSNTLREHGFDTIERNGSSLCAETEADIFVVDASGPSGRVAIRNVRDHYPDTPIVAMVPAAWNGPGYHAATLTDGAIAAVSRDAPRSVIVPVVRAAIADWSVLVLPGVEVRAFGRVLAQTLVADPPLSPMTQEEQVLLRRLFAGATREMIADDLHFALRTVDRRMHSVYQKLNAANKLDAILRALFWGYLTSPPTAAPDGS